ncbi:glycoside hydrolase family 5 protein [Piromyces sp. E2]|nr:glycoside hydrolase family 5 protein [Piromyces sp. E2]|eukprot:OUM69972.1 glycoside hydrolase family 5 protein [Piromyces sp. E2]
MNYRLIVVIFSLFYSLIYAFPTKKGTTLGLHVSGNKLLDGEGKEFIFRGVNIPHNWFHDKTEFSLKEIAALGANSARIVLGNGSKFSKNSVEDVEQVIEWCENLNLVCVFEIHDFTGSDDPTNITMDAIEYWKDFKDLFNTHKDYIILNIANEWMAANNQSDLWAETYISAIKSLRKIGFEGAIMVDTSGYGQEAASLISHAPKIVKADPTGNVIFDCHVYAALGKDDATIINNFNVIKSNGICFIVGEFGWWHYGNNVAFQTLLKYSAENNIGWISWSWAGNSGIDNILDLTSPKTFAKEDLTDWGKFVFYSQYGIQNTSKLAYGKVNKVIYNTNPSDATVIPIKQSDESTSTSTTNLNTNPNNNNTILNNNENNSSSGGQHLIKEMTMSTKIFFFIIVGFLTIINLL